MLIHNFFVAKSFDVVQPVRKATSSPGAPDGEKLSLTLEGPVSYDQTPARRVAMTTYTGPSPGLHIPPTAA